MESRTRNAQVDFPRCEVLISLPFLSLSSSLRENTFGILAVTDGCMKLQYYPTHAALLWVEHILQYCVWVAKYVEGNAIYHFCAKTVDLRTQIVSNAWQQETC
jgi:hypothetical protein